MTTRIAFSVALALVCVACAEMEAGTESGNPSAPGLHPSPGPAAPPLTPPPEPHLGPSVSSEPQSSFGSGSDDSTVPLAVDPTTRPPTSQTSGGVTQTPHVVPSGSGVASPNVGPNEVVPSVVSAGENTSAPPSVPATVQTPVDAGDAGGVDAGT